MSDNTSADLTLVAEQLRILLIDATAMRRDMAALIAKARHLDKKWSVLPAKVRGA